MRERLAAHCTFVLGREAALALAPTADPDAVARRQRETEEARHFIDGGGDLGLTGAADIRTALERAVKGGVLPGIELRQVADTLRAARLARSALDRRRRDAPTLAALAERLPQLRDMEDRIVRSISPQGEVEDAASPLLREVRGQARVSYARLESSLHRIMRSSLGRDALQEALVTERNGRLVLPVKTEARRRLPGLVHDVSDSGATVFLEPLATVNQGNQWRELRLSEAREVERVLRDLSGSVAEHEDDLQLALELLARLDLALAKGHYARSLRARAVDTPSGGRPYVRIVEGRHPLLREPVVPISLEMGTTGSAQQRVTEATVLVVTGPNAGGKTVSLKTIGLLAIMHQAGLQVPAAEGTVLPLFDGVYADIGDQQSIERSLSTFTSHISNIRSIMAAVSGDSLVVLDEVGSSTDPEEGAALAKAALDYFRDRGTLTVATTHHREVAAFVQETPGMANASVELDPGTLAPTYRLTMGLPGRSYALAIASRLGLPQRVLDRARALLAPLHRNLDEMLAGVQQDRQAAAEAHAAAESALADAEALREEAEAQLERLRTLEAEAHQGLRGDLQARADTLLDRLQAAERALTAAPPGTAPETAVEQVTAVRQARAEVQAVRREVRSKAWAPRRTDRAAWLRCLEAGERVQVRGFPGAATLLSPPDANGTVEVAIGALRARVPLEHLMHAPSEADGPAPAPARRPHPTARTRPVTAGADDRTSGGPVSAQVAVELDLRGQRVEEASARLDEFLDRALLQGRSRVRVVHGVGTGALRAALREQLSGHAAVRSWSAEEGERSDGAAVVELV